MDSSHAASLDLARALAALQKGWISPERFRALLRVDAEAGSLVERLKAHGDLPPSRLAELYGSTVLLGTTPLMKNLCESGLRLAEAGDALHPGDWIAARYRILKALKGGFGRVYLCEARVAAPLARGDTLVALKTPLPHLTGDPASRKAFEAEAARWISLGAHPNLVMAYGLETHQHRPFVVMECIEGARSLHDEIQDGPLHWLRALWVALDAAKGLAHAERTLGLVHGDLKPLNLLLTSSGVIKIADFGLSVQPHLDPGDEEILAGTLGYLAPEMYEGHPRRTTATDMYAYGVTLFEALTGRRPFSDLEPWRNCLEPPPNLRESVRGVPEAFADLIAACLDPDPAARPTSFQALVEALETLHRNLQGTASPPAPAPDAPAEVETHLNLALSWANLGRNDLAEAEALAALRKDPSEWRAHLALGNLRLKTSDPRQARDHFERAHRLAPEAIEPLVNLGLTAKEAGDFDRARARIEEALSRCVTAGRFAELDPASGLLTDTLEPAQALQVMDAILEEDPGAVITWNNRAILLRRMGRPDDALTSADRALAVNPDYPKAWSNRANALLELGRMQDALSSAERALALDPALPGAYTAKATAWAQLGRLELARQCIRAGLQHLPENPLLLRAQHMFEQD